MPAILTAFVDNFTSRYVVPQIFSVTHTNFNSSATVSPCRATDKAHSILKECAENLGQAVGSLPPSDPAARQNTSNQDDSMDTSTSNTVSFALAGGSKLRHLLLICGINHFTSQPLVVSKWCVSFS